MKEWLGEGKAVVIQWPVSFELKRIKATPPFLPYSLTLDFNTYQCKYKQFNLISIYKLQSDKHGINDWGYGVYFFSSLQKLLSDKTYPILKNALTPLSIFINNFCKTTVYARKRNVLIAVMEIRIEKHEL